MPERAVRAIEIGQRLKQTIVAEIGDGIMLYPSYTRRAPRHHTALLPPIQWAYTRGHQRDGAAVDPVSARSPPRVAARRAGRRRTRA